MTKETQLDGPYALILAPTRELALQISKETEKVRAVPYACWAFAAALMAFCVVCLARRISRGAARWWSGH